MYCQKNEEVCSICCSSKEEGVLLRLVAGERDGPNHKGSCSWIRLFTKGISPFSELLSCIENDLIAFTTHVYTVCCSHYSKGAVPLAADGGQRLDSKATDSIGGLSRMIGAETGDVIGEVSGKREEQL